MGQAEGTETFRFSIPDRILEVRTEVPAQGSSSVSLKFFKPDEKLIYFVSINKDGDMWTLTEPVGGKVAQSKPHKNADGSVTYLRFEVLRETEDEKDVQMEASPDGKTWRKVFRQSMVRQKEAPGSAK